MCYDSSIRGGVVQADELDVGHCENKDHDDVDVDERRITFRRDTTHLCNAVEAPDLLVTLDVPLQLFHAT